LSLTEDTATYQQFEQVWQWLHYDGFGSYQGQGLSIQQEKAASAVAT